MPAKKKTSGVTAKTVKKAKAPLKKAPAKKASKVEKVKVKAVEAKSPKVTNAELASLDRKTLAGRARKLKLELLAIRFNVQAPSLKEFRKKRQELTTILSHLDR